MLPDLFRAPKSQQHLPFPWKVLGVRHTVRHFLKRCEGFYCDSLLKGITLLVNKTLAYPMKSLAVAIETPEPPDFLLQRDPPRRRRLRKGALALVASVPQLVLASFVHVSVPTFPADLTTQVCVQLSAGRG